MALPTGPSQWGRVLGSSAGSGRESGVPGLGDHRNISQVSGAAAPGAGDMEGRV